MEKFLSLSKRRGFIFQNSEIYGGINATWDYGPLGVEIKRNINQVWWQSMVYEHPNVVGLDSAILMHPRVWEASGHLQNFTDPLVECTNCHQRFRADDLLTSSNCPKCGGILSAPRQFNLMFSTTMGPLDSLQELLQLSQEVSKHLQTTIESFDKQLFEIETISSQLSLLDERIKEVSSALQRSRIYLRPETAQGIFTNFANIANTSRLKLPFGIAQIGKAFRNEITPGNFTFRTREFEQMELEFFVKPGTDEDWFNYWVENRLKWYIDLGIHKDNLRLREHSSENLAHYAKKVVDIEYKFPWGWAELEGIANRTDFDLRQHTEYSGQQLQYFDEETHEHYYPYIIEPSGGVDRAALAILLDSYCEETIQPTQPGGKPDSRTLLKLNPQLSPYKVAILPLSRNEKIIPLSLQIYKLIRGKYSSTYDTSQSIGRRYRRQDEIGTPYCITIDFDSLNDSQVTLRDRDTMMQIRVPIKILMETLEAKLKGSSSH